MARTRTPANPSFADPNFRLTVIDALWNTGNLKRELAAARAADSAALVGVLTQTDYLELARRSLLGLPLER